MPNEPFYPGADTTTQNFSRNYPGAPIHPNVNVLHTTEGTDWPDYGGGSTAPHLTVKPVISERRFVIRQHFPMTMSSRALRNEPGGVETNTLNCLQIELIGTCDPTHRDIWGTRHAGRDYIFWPQAPDWALRELAGILAWMHKQWAIKLRAPKQWPPYPDSYGKDAPQRLSPRKWQQFYGTVGHMHVCENDHGDPGNIDIQLVMQHARRICQQPATKTPRADAVARLAERAFLAAKSEERKQKWQAIRQLAEDLRHTP